MALFYIGWKIIFRQLTLLLVSIFLAIPFISHSQQSNVFVHNLRDDFPEIEGWISRIFQDQKGYIWFAGESSVQKFDGNSVRTYPFYDLLEKNKKNMQGIGPAGFLKDSYGNTWVFAGKGLFIYHPQFDRFTWIDFAPPFESFFRNYIEQPEISSISALAEDHNKNLWIGTSNGLLIYIPLDSILVPLHACAFPPQKLYLNKSCIIPVHYRDLLAENIAPPYFMKERLGKEYFCPQILKILQDKDGDIWINTHCRIFRMVLKNGTWSPGGTFFENSGQTTYWTKNIFLDKEKNLWIGVRNYLAYKKSKIAPFQVVDDIPESILEITKPYGENTDINHLDFNFAWHEFPHDLGFQGHTGWIDNVHAFNDNQLIIVNENAILNYKLSWNEKNEPEFIKIHEFTKTENNPKSWKYRLTGVLLTQEGVLFGGDFTNGVFMIDMNHHKMFRKLFVIKGDSNSLPDLKFSSMLDIGNDHILLGGRENTIYKTDYKFTFFNKLPLKIDFIGNIDTWILKLIEDNHGCIWAHNFLGQVAVIKKSCISESSSAPSCSQQIFRSNFGVAPETPFSISDVVLNRTQTMWFSTNHGLFYGDISRYAEDTDWSKVIFSKYTPDNNPEDSIIFTEIDKIIPVRDDFFLLVTDGDWIQFDPLSRNYWKIKRKEGDDKFLPRPRLWSFYLDNTDQIWTNDYLNLFKIKFIKNTSYPPYEIREMIYAAEDGFPPRALEFVTDDDHNLWIYSESGRSGIYRYDVRTNEIINFEGQGIINGSIFGGLKGRDRAGRIYFGAMDGITVFHPDSVRRNPFIPPVEITDIKVLHRSIYQGNDTMRLVSLNKTNTLTLNPHENVLSIEFSALSFSNPVRNQYAYYLSGFDQDTVFTSAANRIATYSNLSPGTYQFYVNGSNNNYTWNPDWTQLNINVLSPWYATTFAYITYFLILIILFTGWRYYDFRRIRLQQRLKLERAEAERLRQLDHMKTEFFSNISHEFRTPLTLILAPLENFIQGRYNGDLRKEAEIMKRNARRLLRLINQILKLSKLDAGKMKLQASEQDLSIFLRDVTANFESAARNNKIALSTYLPRKPFMAYFDSEKMEDIIENLIGNALKFTPTGGKVIIRLGIHSPDECAVLQKYGPLAEISIQDTGIGIQSGEIERIFDRFYQIDSSHTRRHEGAGIGLALVNELVKLHHGTITVQSRPGKGTVFMILIPRGKHHLSEDEMVPIAETSNIFVQGMEGVPRDKIPVKRISDLSLEKTNTLLPLILVVEDNADMRHYITHNLDHQFTFIEADNGFRGFGKAVDTVPDLIITDLMMPGMDGYEFCRKIRKDERTRHIPIIMLTAKARKENLISGYECGVDDYVIKPFDQEILLTRIHNLLQQRRLLREKFTKQWIRSGVEISASSTDDKFIKRINEILEKHYINPGFGSRLFTKEVGLSRSALYRKLKAISNLSPSTYIRNFRLIKAYQIISLGESDVSSAAYATGFNNLSYFSRSFKQLFKKAPHDFYAQDKVG